MQIGCMHIMDWHKRTTRWSQAFVDDEGNAFCQERLVTVDPLFCHAANHDSYAAKPCPSGEQKLYLPSTDEGGVRGCFALYAVTKLITSTKDKAANRLFLRARDYHDIFSKTSSSAIIAILLDRLHGNARMF